jgi:hypothetical protein
MRAVSFLFILAAVSARVTVGCGGGDASCGDAGQALGTGAPSDASTLQDATTASDDAAPAIDNSESDAEPPLTSLRVANWSADAPPVDFCLAPHGTGAFLGPLLAARAEAIDEAGAGEAGAPMLPFPAVSAYLVMPPGRYDARVVAAGATDCSAGVIPDATSLPPFLRNAATTIALIGANQPQASEPGLQIVGFPDEDYTPTGVAVRAINASADLPLVDIGIGTKFQLLFTGIRFGASSRSESDAGPTDAAPIPDPDGYVTQAFSGATVIVRSTNQTTSSAVATNVTVASGVRLTFVVIGGGAVEDAGGSAAQLLECVDNAGTAGLFSDCSVISQ